MAEPGAPDTQAGGGPPAGDALPPADSSRIASAGRRTIGLGLVLVCASATMLVGVLSKAPCASGDWRDGRQYRLLCYSDIVPLLGTEQLATGNRLPYLDRCSPAAGSCDEYPVLTMWTMRLAAWAAPPGPPVEAEPTRSYSGFFGANVLILALAAFATAIALYMMVGGRALFFVLAPTLAIYGFVNWDLLAVALATLATLALLDRRDVRSGALLALGTAAKLYPAMLAGPFALGRVRERRPVGAVHLLWTLAGVWIALNLPFALFGRPGWWEFFSFNSKRTPDWDSLWYIACDRIPGVSICDHAAIVDLLSLLLFVLASAALWRFKEHRSPGFPAWTFGFPLLVIFLLTNKVYSPQYGLWLLPWFALVLPDLRAFAAFEAADVAVFVTRFAFFGQMDPAIGGWVDAFTIGWFQVAVLVRAAVLVWCVTLWVLRDPSPLATPIARREVAVIPA